MQVVGGDGTDMDAFEEALKKAQAEKGRPSLFSSVRTSALGPNFQDTHTAHGAVGRRRNQAYQEELRLGPGRPSTYRMV